LHAVILRVQPQMQTQYYEVKYCQFDIISNIQNNPKPIRNTRLRHENAFSRITVMTLKMLSVPRVYFFYSQSLSDIRLHQSTCWSYFQGLSMHIMHILVQVHVTWSIFLHQIWMLTRNMWKIFNLWYLKWN